MRISNRAGFALPMAILIIAVLTAALAAAFTATTSEVSTNAAQRGTDRAFNIAQAGLEQFLVRRSEAGFCQSCMADPTDSTNSGLDSARVMLPGGYADVIARRVRPMLDRDNPAQFFIRSRGVDTSKLSIGSRAGNRRAERTVGIYAIWNTNTIKVLSGWTSLSGLSKEGTAGEISGVDECGQAPAVAGVAVPNGSLSVQGNWQATGTPPADTFKTSAELNAIVGIDWAAIRNGAIEADFTVPPDAFPDLSWFNADPDRWPIIHVTTNFSLPNKGRGMLIVDGNLDILGSEMWDGVILVGGRLTSNGFNTVGGATITGLNVLLGAQADTSVVESGAQGTKDFVYNSCKVALATKGLRSYKTLPNTWVDNVTSW